MITEDSRAGTPRIFRDHETGVGPQLPVRPGVRRGRTRPGTSRSATEEAGLQPRNEPLGDRRGRARHRNEPLGDRRGRTRRRNEPLGDRRGRTRRRNEPLGDRRGRARHRNEPLGDRRGRARHRNEPLGVRRGRTRRRLGRPRQPDRPARRQGRADGRKGNKRRSRHIASARPLPTRTPRAASPPRSRPGPR